MLFLKQPFILPFLCHKSATTCQVDSCEVPNSKMKPDLCNCVKTEIIESMAPLQQPHKWGTVSFRDTLHMKALRNGNKTILLQNSRFYPYPLRRDKVGKKLFCELVT